jgi:hypothetical protein
MGPHCPAGGCTTLPTAWLQVASSLSVSERGVQVTVGAAQVQAAHTAGSGTRPAWPV